MSCTVFNSYFRHFYLMKGGQNCSATSVNGPEILAKKPKADPPKWFDWRLFGAVTHVKVQKILKI